MEAGGAGRHFAGPSIGNLLGGGVPWPGWETGGGKTAKIKTGDRGAGLLPESLELLEGVCYPNTLWQLEAVLRNKFKEDNIAEDPQLSPHDDFTDCVKVGWWFSEMVTQQVIWKLLGVESRIYLKSHFMDIIGINAKNENRKSIFLINKQEYEKVQKFKPQFQF